jgi:gluconate 2-dehydrogenase gamma chain
MTDAATATRRDFLTASASALGGAWLATALPALAALSACARDAAERGDPFTTLTPAEGGTMAAFAENILPSDDLPGAREAGVVYFIDAALGSLFVPMRDLIKQGLADLDARAARSGASSFASLSSEQQVSVMKETEATPFFFNARMLTMMGVLSDPKYGGNRDNVGFDLLRREHGGAWQPPFGYYDSNATDARSGGVS